MQFDSDFGRIGFRQRQTVLRTGIVGLFVGRGARFRRNLFQRRPILVIPSFQKLGIVRRGCQGCQS